MICVRIYTNANSPSPEIADEIAPLIHSVGPMCRVKRVIIYGGRAVMIVIIVATGLVSDSAVLSGVSICHQVTRRHFAIDTIAKGPDLSPKYSLG